MSRNPGIIVELPDGRKGIAYSKKQNRQLFKSRLLINIVDEKFQPVKNEAGKEITVFKYPDEVKLIGHVD